MQTHTAVWVVCKTTHTRGKCTCDRVRLSPACASVSAWPENHIYSADTYRKQNISKHLGSHVMETLWRETYGKTRRILPLCITYYCHILKKKPFWDTFAFPLEITAMFEAMGLKSFIKTSVCVLFCILNADILCYRDKKSLKIPSQVIFWSNVKVCPVVFNLWLCHF